MYIDILIMHFHGNMPFLEGNYCLLKELFFIDSLQGFEWFQEEAYLTRKFISMIDLIEVKIKIFL